MGRQSRLRQQRRTAAFHVRSPGMLEVLSVGKGDLKIAIGDSNKDRADAQRLIEEMLRKGYTLFVETDDGPLKVTRFDPDAMVYVVIDTPDVVSDAATREHMRRWADGEESHPGEECRRLRAGFGGQARAHSETPAQAAHRARRGQQDDSDRTHSRWIGQPASDMKRTHGRPKPTTPQRQPTRNGLPR